MSKHQQESVHHDTQPVDYPGTTACVCIQATKWVRTTCKNPAKIQCWKIQKHAFQKINIDLENS
jgi:hypothetical protein